MLFQSLIYNIRIPILVPSVSIKISEPMLFPSSSHVLPSSSLSPIDVDYMEYNKYIFDVSIN